MVRFAVLACGDNHSPPITSDCTRWGQWGGDAAHDGSTCVSGQALGKPLSHLDYDPLTPGELVDSGGELTVHYPAPLVDGDHVYMLTKTGTYTPCETGSNGMPDCYEADELYRLNTQVWTETAYTIDASGVLTKQWSFDSGWKPEPALSFEPMFQAALAGELIVIPGENGSVWELDRMTGAVVRHVTPFADDLDTYVAGGIAVAPFGTVYYNALKLDHDMPFYNPSRAWLVAVHGDGSADTVDYDSIAPSHDVCRGYFDPMTVPFPWPPPDVNGVPVLPPIVDCGPQLPGINTTPAVGADGTIFLATGNQYYGRASYLIALDLDLGVKWATSLHGILHDGCGVLDPYCSEGAAMGVDESTNEPPDAVVGNSSSSSPVALPDGGVIYGALTFYNAERGHLIKLDAHGTLAGTYDFGWDTTPAVIGDATDYKIILKDNHYGSDENGVDLGPYYITELDSSLNIVWQFQSTNTQSCVRQPDGTTMCTADHPHGFEWCVNAPAVDSNGVTYVNSEDGNVYAITADGHERDHLFLDQALGAAYTPVALDPQGRVLALNKGTLTVVGAP